MNSTYEYYERIYNRVKIGHLRYVVLPYKSALKINLKCNKYNEDLFVDLQLDKVVKSWDFSKYQELHSVSEDIRAKLFPGSSDYFLYQIKKVSNKMSNVMKTISKERIFRTGTWKGQKYTLGDLDDMITNFHDLKDTYQPSLKCGHSDETKEEALGWIIELYKEDEWLLGDFSISMDIFESHIKTQKLRFKSCEIVRNYKYAGKMRKNLLTAVALLGVNPPCVSGLKSIQFSDSTKAEFINKFDFDTKLEKEMDDTTDKKGNEMAEVIKTDEVKPDTSEVKIETTVVTPEVKVETPVTLDPIVETKVETKVETPAEISAPVVETKVEPPVLDTFKAKFDEMKISTDSEIAKLRADLDAANKLAADNATKVELFKYQAMIGDISNFTENLVRNGNLMPKNKAQVVAVLEALTVSAQKVKFSEKDTPALDIFKSFLGNIKQVEFKELASDTSVNDDPISPPSLDEPKKYMTIGMHDYSIENTAIADRAKMLVDEAVKSGKKIDLEEAFVQAEREVNKK